MWEKGWNGAWNWLFDLYKASIVGTGKSIDFYSICLKLFKVA